MNSERHNAHSKAPMNYRAIIGLLLVAILVVAMQHVLVERDGMVSDGRQTLALEPDERAWLRQEMQQYLAATRAIVAAIGRADTGAAAAAARDVRTHIAADMPASLAAKLPAEFKALDAAVRAGFDRLAANAESAGDGRQALTQLGDTLDECLACHAAYGVVAASALRMRR